MRKKIFLTSILILASLFVFWPTQVLAQSKFGQAIKKIPNQNVNIAKTEVVDHALFTAGENVNISGTINGDVFAAGSNLIIDGKINGDVFVVGGTVTFSGQTTGSLRVAGSTLLVKGMIGRNVTVAGGTITLTNEAKINGDLLVMGGQMNIETPVTRDVYVYGSQVILGSKVGRNLIGQMENLTLEKSAKINGDLTYKSPQEANLAQGVVITGKTFYTQSVKPVRNLARPKVNFWGIPHGLRFYLGVASFILALILGSLFVALFPNKSESVVKVLGPHLGKSLLIGLLAFILFPMVLFLLAVSLIGIPFIFLVIPVFVILVYFGKILAAFYLGHRIGFSHSRFWALFVGLLIVYALGLVRILGPVVGLLFNMMGAGAILLDFHHGRMEKK